MKIVYFDCFAGISGNMILGALIDIGVPENYIIEQLQKVPVSNYEIKIDKVLKNGVSATYVNVLIEKEKHRHPADIEYIIEHSSLSPNIKSKSKQIFRTIAEAECKIHNKSMEQIHFHEVGSTDAIIDVVGSLIGLEYLNVSEIYSSPIHLGKGFVHSAHGKIPVPAPATSEILKSVPVYSGDIEAELATPTGASIIRNLAKAFQELPKMIVYDIGYGAGSYDLKIPNTLRLLMGEIKEDSSEDKAFLIETNIDDLSSEIMGYVFEKLFEQGALDVYFTPIYMKKNRPAVKISVIAYEKKLDQLVQCLFSETTTLGLRIFEVNRKIVQERELKKIDTQYGQVKVKISSMDGQIVNQMPEYEDCKKIAQEKNIPLKEVYQNICSIL